MNAVRTPVCELLGIEQPVVLAPMVAVPRLAAAVSNAGALGMLTLTWSEDVGAVVRETAALTARPFCGNRYEPAPPMTGTTGDIEALSMWAGQSVALARQPQPAADIVAELTSRL